MIERQDIEFTSQGLRCAGWLYRAQGRDRSQCIVLAHGFGGTKEMRLDAYAEAFAEAGYHALVFDYRHFGDSQGEPRQILSIRRQQQDWHAAIRFARELEGVDPGRIILWGTSFSGGHVISVASREKGIAAVISQVPHLSGPATAVASGPVQNLRLASAAWRDIARMAMRRSPYYVPIIGKPGELAAMTAPDAEEGVKKLYPEGFKPNESVAARIFLTVGLYSPGRLSKRLDMPLLVQAAMQDLTTPLRPAYRTALRAPLGQFIAYKCGHFDVYVPPRFEQTIGDQLTFLKSALK